MKLLMAVLLLGTAAAPGHLLGQAPVRPPTPATIATARQNFIALQKTFLNARTTPPTASQYRADCAPGPVESVLQIPGWFEGVAVSHSGDIFISDQITLEVYRITPNGRVSVFADLFDMDNPDAMYAGTLGMQFSRNGDLWIATLNFLDRTKHGIYRVRPDGRSDLAIPMNPDLIPVPNGLAFDEHDNLYVTESFGGVIWKAARGRNVATLWSAGDLLTPPPTGLYGANGIAYKDRSLFVSNTDKGTIVKVPLNHDGSPGEPTVFASGLNGPDGVTVGPCGDLYVACAYGGQLVRIDDDGTWEIVLDKDLGYPTSPAFGKTDRTDDTVYIANFLSLMNGVPNLIKADLCKSRCRE